MQGLIPFQANVLFLHPFQTSENLLLNVKNENTVSAGRMTSIDAMTVVSLLSTLRLPTSAQYCVSYGKNQFHLQCKTNDWFLY